MAADVESEATLEKKLIESLVNNSYERVNIKDKDDLELNFKKQLEKFNNTTFTDNEFKKILIHLEGGSIFEKAKKIKRSICS